MTVLKPLLDRIHAVNQEISVVNSALTLNCSRYYPNLKAPGALPIITPVPPAGTHNNVGYGSDSLHSIWLVPLILFVDNFLAGHGPEDAQKNCEACIDHVLLEYWNRPRLELLTPTLTQSAGAYVDIMEDARLTTNTTIEVASNEIAVIRFTLTVETVIETERI